MALIPMKALLLAGLLLLTALAVVPAAQAAPPTPDCYPVYSRTDVGPLAIVRPTSCSVRLYWCPTQGAPISQCEDLIQ